MPWIPELFSAPALQQLEEKAQRQLVTVPFFDGVITGELDALLGSFAGEPELHHPLRGRVKGELAFASFVNEMRERLTRRHFSFEATELVSVEGNGFEDGVLHLDGERGPVDLPLAIVADRRADGRLDELRLYFSSRPLIGYHVHRQPLLQSAVRSPLSDVVADYERALSSGDIERVLAAFEPDGYIREPGGETNVHRGAAALRAFHEWLFSNGGGVSRAQCAAIDDGRACALEYNLVRWGRAEAAPEAGIAVYVRGESGKLAAVRTYDDAKPPLARA